MGMLLQRHYERTAQLEAAKAAQVEQQRRAAEAEEKARAAEAKALAALEEATKPAPAPEAKVEPQQFADKPRKPSK